jgi:hypothetical protein
MQLVSQQLNMELPAEPLPSSASSGIMADITAGLATHAAPSTSHDASAAADAGIPGSNQAVSLLQGLQQVLERYLDAAGPAAGDDRSAGSSISTGSGNMTLSEGLQQLLQQHLDALKDSSRSSSSSPSSSLSSSVTDSDVVSLSSSDISLSSLSSNLSSLNSGAGRQQEAHEAGHPAADAGSSYGPGD